jgi:hypothetical protein
MAGDAVPYFPYFFFIYTRREKIVQYYIQGNRPQKVGEVGAHRGGRL